MEAMHLYNMGCAHVVLAVRMDHDLFEQR